MTQQPDDQVEQKPAWWMPRYIKTQAATITALRQRVAELEGAVLAEREACAQVMENLCFFTPIEELMGMTKQQMSVQTCHEGAKAIRNRSNDHAD